MMVSIVAVGSGEVKPFLEDGLAAGEKAFESNCAMCVVGQVIVMLSGNFESSITKTSEEERRPRRRAEAASSVLRVEPRPSAFPVSQLGQLDILRDVNTASTYRC